MILLPWFVRTNKIVKIIVIFHFFGSSHEQNQAWFLFTSDRGRHMKTGPPPPMQCWILWDSHCMTEMQKIKPRECVFPWTLFVSFFWQFFGVTWQSFVHDDFDLIAFSAQHCFGGSGGELDFCLNFKILNNFKYHLSKGVYI